MASHASLHSPKEWVLCCCFSGASPPPPPQRLFSCSPFCSTCSEMLSPPDPPRLQPRPLIGSDCGRHRQIRGREEKRWGDFFLLLPSSRVSQNPISLGTSHTMSPPAPAALEGATASCCCHLRAPRCLASIPCPYIHALSLKAFSFKPGVSNFGPQAKCLLPTPNPLLRPQFLLITQFYQNTAMPKI